MTWIDQPTAWNRQRGRELTKLLAKIYQEKDEVRVLLENIGAENHLPPDSPTPEVRWHDLAKRLHGTRRLRELLELVVEDNPRLAGDIERLSADDPENAVGNPADAYQVRLIGPARRPLIDRTDFRSNLRQFLDQRWPVLLIRGPEKSGKSFSFELMNHVVGGLDDPRLTMIDFSHPASGNDAVALMAMIRDILGIEPLDAQPRTSTSTNLAKRLVHELVGDYTFADMATRILVIDGLSRKDLAGDVNDMVVQLATDVVRGQLRRTKLVLTGYTGTFDEQIRHSVLPEDIRTITETDVWLYFRDLGTDLGKELTKTELDDLVAEAMRGEAGLEALADRVHKLVLSLVGAA
jgi:hypothetical protein